MIRGIVLPQPEASLVCFGIRQFTRHDSNTGSQLRIGERVAIIASFKFDPDRLRERFYPFYEGWIDSYHVPYPDRLPCGCVVGTAVFSGSSTVDRVYRSISWRDQVTEDWYTDPGFAHRWRDTDRFSSPFSLDGHFVVLGELVQLSQHDQGRVMAEDRLSPPHIRRLSPID